MPRAKRQNPRAKTERIAEKWVESFEGKFRKAEIQDVTRSFNGTALVKVRATVGNDSYERLVNVTVPLGDVHRRHTRKASAGSEETEARAVASHLKQSANLRNLSGNSDFSPIDVCHRRQGLLIVNVPSSLQAPLITE